MEKQPAGIIHNGGIMENDRFQRVRVGLDCFRITDEGEMIHAKTCIRDLLNL